MANYADGITPYDISDNKSVLINQFVPPTFCLYFAFTGINSEASYIMFVTWPMTKT